MHHDVTLTLIPTLTLTPIPTLMQTLTPTLTATLTPTPTLTPTLTLGLGEMERHRRVCLIRCCKLWTFLFTQNHNVELWSLYSALIFQSSPVMSLIRDRDGGRGFRFWISNKWILVQTGHRRRRRGAGGGKRAPPLKFGKIFFGKFLCKIRACSSKNDVKLGNFFNFSGKYKNSCILTIFRTRIV